MNFNVLFKTCLICCVFVCSTAHSQAKSVVSETSAYVLGSLLAAKIQQDLKFEAINEISMASSMYRDIVMIYRSEVITCNGFLDSLDTAVINKIALNKWIELIGDDIAALDRFREADPELDAKAKAFAKSKLPVVMNRFAKGNWAIQPSCLTDRYQPRPAK